MSKPNVGQEYNIATALFQMPKAPSDTDSKPLDRETLRKDLKYAYKEVAHLKKELHATRTQIRDRKEGAASLAKRLKEHHDDIEYLRACEDEWLQDLERHAMRPMIGIEVQEALNADGSACLHIASLAQKGTAFKAGLQVGDIITRFGKQDINSKRLFAQAMLAAPIGSKVPIHVIRHGVTPSGKPCTSVESIQVVIAGAPPSGFSLELLRESEDPEALVVQCRKEGISALAAIGDVPPSRGVQ